MSTYFTEGVLKEVIGLGLATNLEIKISPTTNFSLKSNSSDYIVWVARDDSGKPIGDACVIETKVTYAVPTKASFELILPALLGKNIRFHGDKAKGPKISLASIDVI